MRWCGRGSCHEVRGRDQRSFVPSSSRRLFSLDSISLDSTIFSCISVLTPPPPLPPVTHLYAAASTSPALPIASRAKPAAASKMPSRKSDSSEKAEPRRTSLRRLGSIASLTSLNPFNRRRSNNTVTDSPASSSNLSLSSTTANAPQPSKAFSCSQIFAEPDIVEETPSPSKEPQPPARKNNYICLPDDPIGGMPRSRTFSNLPIPTRMRKASAQLAQSKSHARLPSTLLPASRIPSPRPTTRKHSVTRLATIESNCSGRESLGYTGTKPLLHFSFDQTRRRSTTLKENVSLSPTKQEKENQAGRKDSKDYYYHSAIPFRSYYERHALSGSRHPSQASMMYGHSHAPSSTASTMSLTKYAELPEGAYKRLSQKYESSPIYRPSRERVPTPGQKMQRGYSQPVLPTQPASSKPDPPLQRSDRSSFGEIKQTRLMSTMPPPTPPPPKTPLGSEILGQSQLRRSNTSSIHVPQPVEKTPTQETVAQLHPVSKANAETNRPNPNGSIRRAEPPAYFTGRFSSLNDRYRNEEMMQELNLDACNSPTTWSSKAESDKMHTPAATEARMRRAVEFLYSECATDEARQSFFKWQKQLTAVLNAPELSKPVGGKSCALQMSLADGEGDGQPPLSAGRKISFMDRLLGKKGKVVGARG